MLRSPDQFLFASLDRMLAVVFGFAVAVGFHLIPTVRARSAQASVSVRKSTPEGMFTLNRH